MAILVWPEGGGLTFTPEERTKTPDCKDVHVPRTKSLEGAEAFCL